VKLRLLTSLSSEKVDYLSILKETFKVEKLRWYHAIIFIKTCRKISKEVEQLRGIDPKKTEEHPDCKIKRPESIDMIAYGAMTELQVLFQNPGEKEIGELIIEVIALSCYESHTKKPFDSDSKDFKQFKEEVAESDLVHMLGLYAWIDKQITASVEKWNRLFNAVRVDDKDWDNAGGAMMEKFSILNTIKKVCADFNVDYHNALKFPYALVQANSYSDATKGYIQDRMRTIIEARMKAKQNLNKT
jgi:hypothetical protein